jgi:carbon-monoxide dehydrogenase large subunit
VHDELGTNAVVHWSHGGGGDQGVFDNAPVQLRLRYEAPRITPSPIEPRGALASVVPAMGEFTLWTSTQIPHIARVTLSGTTGIPEHKLRIVAPDVGGAFGAKLNVYAEEALCLALARRTGRAVKWIEERSVSYAVTAQGRGVIHDVEVAATEEGKLLGFRVKELADMGAYFQLLTPGIPELGGWVYMGPYDTQGYWYEFTGVMTNMAPTDAVRGAGRPEATYVVERAVDTVARHVGKDPAEIRRISFAPSHAEAKPSLMGLQIDSADYLPAFERALELADYDQYRKEQASRRESGEVKQIGIGLSSYIEMSGLAPSNILGALRYAAGGWEAAQVRCQPSGKVTLNIGTSPHGQGHDTVWSQIAADELGVHPDDVEVLHGDTSISPLGMDTYGSRSISIGGAALVVALQKIKEKARTLAAHELEVAEDDLEFRDGAFRVQGAPEKVRTIPELAVSAWTAHDLPDGYEPDLTAIATWDPKNFTWPFGTHVCVAEVDTETGATHLLRYVAVDDCGVVINPMIVEGQVHGGLAQGIGQALGEHIVYDRASGQLLTASFMDYAMPRASDLPAFHTTFIATPAPSNPLGVKGGSESGAIGAPAAVGNAVIDALWHLGVRNIDIPITPPKVWQILHDKGISYRALAEKTGLSAGYLNHLVHGNRPVPANPVIQSIAKAVGMKADSFREFRIRKVSEALAKKPELVDKVYVDIVKGK